MRTRFASVLAVAFVLSACATDGENEAATEEPPAEAAETSETTVAPGTEAVESFAVETREETFVDATRPTMANRDYPGAPDRTFRVVFHVPQGDGPFPVVELSHGLGGSPEGLEELGTKIARHGYLVVMPEFPLSNGDAPGGSNAGDVANQPADVSFLLDEVIAAGDDPEHWLSGVVDAEHIAIGGHSLGGITTLGFFNSCCGDDRIDAAFPISGRAVNFPGTPYEGISVPLLLIHGELDDLVPYSSSTDAFAAAQSPKYLETFLGGTHGGILRDEQGEILAEVVVDFLDAYLRGDEAAIDEMIEAGNVEGVATLEAA